MTGIVSDSNALDALIDEAVAQGVAPGLVAMVADRTGTLYRHAAGTLAEDAIVWIASLTKAITATAAMQLVERGRLDLDRPAAALFPQLADPEVLTGFDSRGRALYRPARRPITLRHLITHTSGLGYEAMSPDLARTRGDDGPRDARTIASLSGPLLFDPGDGWDYGTGIDWIGLAVEAVTGIPLGAYLAENVFGPLGMADTGFNPAPDARRLATLHHRDADGRFAAIPPLVGGEGWEYQSGGGGLSGAVGDYLRFLRMLLSGGTLDGTRLIGEETCAALMTSQVGPLRAGASGGALAFVANPFDLFPGLQTGWSFAGQTNPVDVPHGRRAGSMGWAGLANSYYWVDPAAGLCAVLTAQFLPFADPDMVGLLRRFESGVYARFT